MASRAAVVASLLPAWPSSDEAASDDDAAQALMALQMEFPGGELDYRRWVIRSLGILGDPVASRAAIKAAVAAGGKTKGNAYGYDRAFTVTPEAETVDRLKRLSGLRAPTGQKPSLLDPFAGGGSIAFEAARFGCQTTANELNPVAAAILEGTLSLPASLGPEFSSVIRRWGDSWADRVGRQLAPFFPHVDSDERLAYIWAHTVPCPSTGRPTPLAPDYWLARGKAGRDVAIRLVVDRDAGTVQPEIVEGKGAAQWGDRATYKEGGAASIWTGETFGGDYIRDRAVAGDMSEVLLAVSVSRPNASGRRFRAPSDRDIAAVMAANRECTLRRPGWEIAGLVPDEAIDDASNYDRGHRMYGILRWSQFFTQRQLLSHVTALEELKTIHEEAKTQLDPVRARALALYLALALDKSIDYNSRQCSWDATRLKIRNTFDKHNFAFKWSFAEFDGASAALPWAVSQVFEAYRGIASLASRPATLLEGPRTSSAVIQVGSAVRLDVMAASVDAIVTDPPYYDNVMYAECSDYFYVWLKRSLRESWPELCGLALTDKGQEVVANPALFERVATYAGHGKRVAGTKSADELANERYEDLLTRSFQEAHRALKADAVMTVMFTHRRVDAWDTLGQALLSAGFSINSSWPVHTESEHSLHQAKKNSASSTILLTCRKRASTQPAYWSDIRSEVARTARESAESFARDGQVGIDLTLSSFGPVLSVLSRNWPVYTGELDTDGKPEVLRPDAALDLAREEVARLKKRGLLGGRDVEFDRVTDWYLLAWSDFAAAEFPAGEALKLSIATHLDLDDLAKSHRIVRAASGWVTLLTPAQRRTAHGLDPEGPSWPTLIDALHALMLVYDEDGLAAARAWLTRTGKADDQRFNDLIAAALRAIPRTKAKGDFVRPEARTLEGLRSTLFDYIPPPVDAPAVVAEQVSMALE